MDDTIDVAVIEDQQDIREGLALLIGSTPGFRCVGAYRSVEEALPGLAHRPPAIALLDIGLPGMSGLEGIRPIRERQPGIQILMLTVYEDDDRIFNALCAGATGYLLKKTPSERLIESIREAVNGGSPISPEVARKVVALFRTFRPRPGTEYDLTGHETRLLRMLVDGHNYTTAAEELKISVNTVAFHMKRIYEKLQVHSKSEAVAKALREGVIQ
jgi:DNA-binding NarL/FixJ family response regulator